MLMGSLVLHANFFTASRHTAKRHAKVVSVLLRICIFKINIIGARFHIASSTKVHNQACKMGQTSTIYIARSRSLTLTLKLTGYLIGASTLRRRCRQHPEPLLVMVVLGMVPHVVDHGGEGVVPSELLLGEGLDEFLGGGGRDIGGGVLASCDGAKGGACMLALQLPTSRSWPTQDT
jgi:hypothetical protein